MATRIHLSNSVRFVLAMFKLITANEVMMKENFGKAVIDILKKQFPGQQITVTPFEVGNKLLAIARKQLQYNTDDAMDAIQDFLAYISTGTISEPGMKIDPKTGEEKMGLVDRKEADPWDFAKDVKTWQEALKNMYANLRLRSMTKSFKKTDVGKRERGIDQTFGKAPEGGGVKEGGEGYIPDKDLDLNKSLDNKTAIHNFMKVIDEHIPDLRHFLENEERKDPDQLGGLIDLFDLIFEDEVGSFSSNIKDNMGQAAALKEKLLETKPNVVAKKEKRWSGYVGNLRDTLLEKIWKYIEEEMSNKDYSILRDEFFRTTSPLDVKRDRNRKLTEKENYERGIDERKLEKHKWREDNKELSDKDKADKLRLLKKWDKLGKPFNYDEMKAVKPDPKKPKGQETFEEEAMVASMMATALKVAFNSYGRVFF